MKQERGTLPYARSEQQERPSPGTIILSVSLGLIAGAVGVAAVTMAGLPGIVVAAMVPLVSGSLIGRRVQHTRHILACAAIFGLGAAVCIAVLGLVLLTPTFGAPDSNESLWLIGESVLIGGVLFLLSLPTAFAGRSRTRSG